MSDNSLNHALTFIRRLEDEDNDLENKGCRYSGESYTDEPYCDECEGEENYLDCDECESCSQYYTEDVEGLHIEVKHSIEVLLWTGGPAGKMTFDYNLLDNSFSNVKLWHQDWYKQWEEVELNGHQQNLLNARAESLVDREIPFMIVRESVESISGVGVY